MELSNETKRKLAATEIIVEATHAEQHMLWCLHAEDSPYTEKIGEEHRVKYPWKQDMSGTMVQIGEIAGKPVVLSGFWATVNDKFCFFYELTSLYCDYTLVKPWLKENCPYATETTNAMNFTGAVHR